MHRKIISITVIIAYFITIIIPSGVNASDISKLFFTEKTLKSALSCGRFYETNISDGEKPDIFFIHELHCNPQAQQNIVEIISFLDFKFNIKTVFSEGAPAGETDLSPIKEIKPSYARNNVLKKMLSEGLISGTEYYCIVNNKTLYGMEDWDLYLQNLKRFILVQQIKSNFLNVLLSAKNDLYVEKIKFYSPSKYIYDSLYNGDKYYYGNIKKLSRLCNVNLNKYPQIKTASVIADFEERFKDKNINKACSYLLNVVRQKISFVEYKNILRETYNKTTEESAVLLYEKSEIFLSDAEKTEYDYIRLLGMKNNFITKINIKSFLTEESNLKKELFELLFKDEKEREVSYLYSKLTVLEDYVNLSASLQEWKELKNDVCKIKKLLKKSSISNKKAVLDILENSLLEDYYISNEQRNIVFFETIKKYLKKGDTYVITAGGFHNDIIRLFEKSGFKYAVIMPDSYGAKNKQYEKIIMNSAVMKDALSEGLFVSNVSGYKQKKFILSFISELRKKGISDEEIKNIIRQWQEKHKNFVILNPKTPYDLAELVDETNKTSLKGKLLRIKKELVKFFTDLKTPFVYKYNNANGKDSDLKEIKNMQSNVRFFPFIEFMLGFNLYSSFSTLFMHSSGYTLGFISVIFSVLAPLSFVSSGLCGFIGDKISKRTLIIISLSLHTIGSILFIFSGLSPVFLALSQVLPVVAISGLGVSMSPFLMSSLEQLNDKDSFKKLYGSNMALFWIIMSVSSLLGGALLFITNQITVVAIAAIVDVACLTGAFIFTHKEKRAQSYSVIGAYNKPETIVKEKISGIFAPLSVLFSDKKTFSIVAVNIAVNNIFFVILCFFLQPSLAQSGLNVAFFAPVYFVANLLQSVGSNTGDRLKNIVMKDTNRTLLFGAGFGLIALFFVTGSPLFLIGLYLLMNFWQAVSSVTEITVVYNLLGDNMRSKWLAFKAMAGTIIASGTQIFITALLSAGVDGNILTAVATAVLPVVSFVVPAVLYSGKKKAVFKKYDIEISNIRILLASS